MTKFSVRTAVMGVAVMVSAICMGACRSDSAMAADGQGGGGVANPSVFLAKFGTRDVRTCQKVMTKPTAAQIPAMIQCQQESKGDYDIALWLDVKVETGGLRAYSAFSDGYATGIDTDAKVMPIRGSMVQWGCSTINADNRGHNCRRTVKPQSEGKCWKTTFGDWYCAMVDTKHIDTEGNLPPPTDK